MFNRAPVEQYDSSAWTCQTAKLVKTGMTFADFAQYNIITPCHTSPRFCASVWRDKKERDEEMKASGWVAGWVSAKI